MNTIHAVRDIAKPTLSPRIVIRIIPAIPMIVAGRVLRPHLFVRTPYTMASTIKRREIIAVDCAPVGFVTKPKVFAASAAVKKVPATTFTKDAITRINTRSAKIIKSFFALEPIESLMISPTDFPSWRIEAKREPKS